MYKKCIKRRISMDMKLTAKIKEDGGY